MSKPRLSTSGAVNVQKCGRRREPFSLMTTLTSPHDLLAAIPFLIGYHPTDSLVIVSLKEDCVGMAMRVDYPITESVTSAEAFDALVYHLVREGAQGALIVAYVPEGRSDGVEILENISIALTRVEIPIRESLLIAGGRWRSVLCADQDCCPAEGNELPEITSSRVAVEQVADGRPMPYGNREGMADSIASLPLANDVDFVTQVAQSCIDPDSDQLQKAQRIGALAVLDLASRFISGSLGRDIAGDQKLSAQVLASLCDIQVRDFALGSHDEASIEIYWTMWRYLIRIAPSGFVAPVASLLAALSYEKGEGALAQRCLDRALADDPSYSLAGLLRRVFSAGWPPESFGAMRRDLHPKVCAGIFDV